MLSVVQNTTDTILFLMGTAYVRVKFTPAVKYFPKENSNNCWLEIIPTVSSIENLDKIEWSRQKGSVEYIVPMTYKIIVKKGEPNNVGVYYSCIDLLSSGSTLDHSAGDVYRHISDNYILSKVINEKFENKRDLDLKENYKKHDNKAPNKVSDVSYLPVSEVKQIKNIQITNYNEHKSEEKDSVLQEERTETENKIDKRNSNDRSNTVSHINAAKNKESLQKLCITKVCNISTADEISCNDCVKTDFITKPCFNPSAKRKDFNNFETKNIAFLENTYRPFYDTFNCFARVEPEIRIAQFVENMEREVLPLKVLLKDLLNKCSSLGLINSVPSNILGVDKYMSLKTNFKNKTSEVQKELQSNRVVYSIVSDS